MLRFLRLLRWRLPPPLTSAHRCGPIGLPRRGQRAGDLTVADQLAGIRPMASTNAPKAVQIALGVLAEEAARQSFRVPRCTRVHVSCRRTCRGDHVRLCAPGPLKASELTLQPRAPARPSRTAHGCLRPTAPRCAKGSATFRAFGLIGVRPRINETLIAFLFSGPSWSPRGFGNGGINAGSADDQALTAYGLDCKRAQTRQLLVAQAARLIERGNER